MTDRFKGVTVAFDRDIREDDAQPIIEAIRQLRGVLSVKPIVAGFEDSIAEERVRRELGQQLLDIIYPERRKRE